MISDGVLSRKSYMCVLRQRSIPVIIYIFSKNISSVEHQCVAATVFLVNR